MFGASMSKNTDSSPLDDSPSRRKFLKVSAVAGAAAAATVVAGAHLIPATTALTTSTRMVTPPVSGEKSKQSPSYVQSGKTDQMIVVVDGDAVHVYQGESTFQIKDESFNRFFSSALRGKIVGE